MGPEWNGSGLYTAIMAALLLSLRTAAQCPCNTSSNYAILMDFRTTTTGWINSSGGERPREAVAVEVQPQKLRHVRPRRGEGARDAVVVQGDIADVCSAAADAVPLAYRHQGVPPPRRVDPPGGVGVKVHEEGVVRRRVAGALGRGSRRQEQRGHDRCVETTTVPFWPHWSLRCEDSNLDRDDGGWCASIATKELSTPCATRPRYKKI